MYNVLVVDDEPAVRVLTARWLDAEGYHARTALGAQHALSVFEEGPQDVVVCDVRMPGHDGLWLAERVRHLHPDTALVMMTGCQDLNTAISSLRLGALDYLVKPFSRDQLRESVENGIRWHEARAKTRQQRESLRVELQRRQHQLAKALESLNIDSANAIEAMQAMLALTNRPVADHTRRVADFALRLMYVLNVSDLERTDTYQAALLHEIGVVALIEQAGARSPEERELLASGPVLAHALLKSVPFLENVSTVLLGMQEWFDGTGFPSGASGDALPMGSRILAVADAFDDLQHPLRFHPPLSAVEARLEIDRARGTRFDPIVVDALHRLLAAA